MTSPGHRTQTSRLVPCQARDPTRQAKAADTRSLRVVLVVTLPPEAVVFLVPAERRSVEPLVHAPQRVEPACVGRVGVVDVAVLQGEGAHAGPFGPVGPPVRADDR